MKVSSILFSVFVLVLVISLLSIWFYPSIQDFMASNTMWNGIYNFSGEFEADNTDSLEALSDSPQNVVLIVIPYQDYTAEELAQIKQFVDAGGSLLLMDDYGYGNNILDYLGVVTRFAASPLLDPLFNFRNQNLPRITDFSSQVKESKIEVVMFNHATALTGVPESTGIAWSSSASFLDLDENGVLDQGELKGPFAVAAEFRLGQGRLALVSDPSIILNAMVDRDDNYEFMRYLTRDPEGQREIVIDISHLTKDPLDVSKTKLIDTRKALSSPYALVGITALIFVVVSRYTLKKGEFIG
ncbi:MAG: DUF4350 domain-containing protein [Dehalococcoidales bacterium]|jgi:hypothetical protein|nr:DUF4350 domain-containing protein [Dehalococcoidales bacterium]